MPKLVTHYLIRKLADWLIAFCISALVIWFVLTQPIFNQINTQSHTTEAVDTNKLKNHVRLLTGGYAPRTINYDNLNHVAAYIHRQFSSVGIPEYQLIETVSKQYKNVILELGPDTDEVYVIGAHYDAENDSIDTEGNASGVSTLIELARHLANNNDKLRIGVILVAYPISLNQADNIVETGSFFHAKSLKENRKQVRLMMSLDSVGKLAEFSTKVVPANSLIALLYPKKENSINVVGRLKDFMRIRSLKKEFNQGSELAVNSHNLPENFNKTSSKDHINYWKQGYPAVLISDESPAPSSQLQNNQPSVGPQEALDYEKMAKLVNGLYQVIVNTDTEIERKPKIAQRSRNNKEKLLLQ